jgi:hypothetical protein
MPRYLVHTRQGGGCDYTIGCGHRVDLITTESLGAAVEKVRQEWFGLRHETPSDPEDEFDTYRSRNPEPPDPWDL